MKEFVPQKKGDTVDKFEWTTPFMILWKFLTLSLFSILIGFFCGLIPTLMTKHFRFLSHSAIIESALFLCWAFVCYYLGELFDLSGIVALLVCTMVESHYGWYNLSPQGKHVTSVTYQTMGYIAEAAVFALIGVSAVDTVTLTPFSWRFVIAEFFIVIIGRYIAVYASYYLFSSNCCPGTPENHLSFKQLTFISWAALIRGAIAFGLINKVTADSLTIPEQSWSAATELNSEVVKSGTLALVVITTIVFGSLTNVV